MNAIKMNYTALANTARECAQLANGVSGTMKWIVSHWNLCCQQSDLLTFTTEARYTRRAALAADMLRMAEQLDRLANDCDAITGEPVEALIVSAANEDAQTTEALTTINEDVNMTTFNTINVGDVFRANTGAILVKRSNTTYSFNGSNTEHVLNEEARNEQISLMNTEEVNMTSTTFTNVENLSTLIAQVIGTFTNCSATEKRALACMAVTNCTLIAGAARETGNINMEAIKGFMEMAYTFKSDDVLDRETIDGLGDIVANRLSIENGELAVNMDSLIEGVPEDFSANQASVMALVNSGIIHNFNSLPLGSVFVIDGEEEYRYIKYSSLEALTEEMDAVEFDDSEPLSVVGFARNQSVFLGVEAA